jgi:hypothetical protein
MRSRLSTERGSALIIALMSVMLLTALGAAVVMVSNTETMISGNYRNSQEALYAADAGVERIVQDLLMIPRWNDILNSANGVAGTRSAFIDGDATARKTLPAGGGQMTLCCDANTATGQLQAATTALNQWGANSPQWKLFAHAPLSSVLPGEIDSPMYVAIWIADDPAEIDGNPLADGNGTLMIHAEALGPSGTRKVIEVTIARTSSTEIERGQIAQRGQEELNQRARKAAVQMPGKTLDNSRMNVRSGILAVQ